MSAIQDALRKARREREASARPQTAVWMNTPAVIPPRRRVGRRWILVALVLLVGGAGVMLTARGVIQTERIRGIGQAVGLLPGPDPATPAMERTQDPVVRSPAFLPGSPGPRETGAASRPETSPPIPLPRFPQPGQVQSNAPVSPFPRPITLEEARRLQASGDLSGAVSVLDALMTREPHRVDVIMALANLYLSDMKDPAKAQPLYERAVALDPRRPTLLVNLGVLYLKAGDRGKAMEQLQKALSVDPNLAEAHYNLACLHALEERRAEAETALNRAVALDPRSADWAKDDPDLALLRNGPGPRGQ